MLRPGPGPRPPPCYGPDHAHSIYGECSVHFLNVKLKENFDKNKKVFYKNILLSISF